MFFVILGLSKVCDNWLPYSSEGVLSKGVLKNFAKFTGNHICRSFFFNKVADFRPVTLLKTKLFEFCEMFQNTFAIEHL